MTWQRGPVEALGMIEVEGVAGIVLAADAACKAASVRLLGWESIGGFTTLFFAGSVADVAASLKRGEAAAREVVEKVVTAAINQPEAVCQRQFAFPCAGQAPPRQSAMGLIETRGYGVQVDANDRMVKAAEVEVVNVMTVHNRVVCTVIEGPIGAVREAIDTARQVLADYEHFLAAAVLPQPAPEVLHLFGRRS
ncbi:MAG: BMC domain-containing protein [Gemmatimonadota bacterium]